MSDAHLNLLDMLAGWEEYNGKVAEAYALAPNDAKMSSLSEEDIAGLYQEAGRLDNPSDEEVKLFIIHKVIPLVLGSHCTCRKENGITVYRCAKHADIYLGSENE